MRAEHQKGSIVLVFMLVVLLTFAGVGYYVYTKQTRYRISIRPRENRVTAITNGDTVQYGFRIPELGVKLILSDNAIAEDLYYKFTTDEGRKQVSFSAQSLKQIDSECMPDKNNIAIVSYITDPNEAVPIGYTTVKASFSNMLEIERKFYYIAFNNNACTQNDDGVRQKEIDKVLKAATLQKL